MAWQTMQAWTLVNFKVFEVSVGGLVLISYSFGPVTL